MRGGASGTGDAGPPGGTGRQPLARVFAAFLMLGLTSFGGPVAHIGYFREAFVTRRRWIEERAYADLVALCQMLPGPTSSQVGIGIGLAKAGLPGAAAAWVGFTLPSAALMLAFGHGVAVYGEAIPPGVLQGLKAVAAAVVAQAVWGMARMLCPDAARATLAVLAALAAVLAPSVVTHVAVIAAGALAGLLFLRPAAGAAHATLGIAVDRRLAVLLLALFLALLIALPILAAVWPSAALALVDGFYRSASLVFGGGHVVLPLLQAEVVPPAGLRTRPSSPATVPPRRCRGRSSPSPPISGRSPTSARAGSWAACSAWAPSSRPRSCWWWARCPSGSDSGASPRRSERCWA